MLSGFSAFLGVFLEMKPVATVLDLVFSWFISALSGCLSMVMVINLYVGLKSTHTLRPSSSSHSPQQNK